MDTFIHEINIMSTMEHENILPLLGIVMEDSTCYIITPYMSHGSLYSVLHGEDKVKISRKEMKRITLEIGRGVHYLHSCIPSIIHRDLKPMNILLDDHLTVKICDFGLSREKMQTQLMSRIGTIQWVAPEIIKEEPYNEKCDVYSFAIVLWELYTHEIPFKGRSAFAIANEVGFKGARLPIPNSCSTLMATLIQMCWAEDATERPGFGEILEMVEEMDKNNWTPLNL